MTAPRPGAGTEAHESTGVAVELHGLTVTAGGRTLLDDVDARFAPREVTLIVGPSGAGKSLLLRVIAGLMDQSHAAIRVSGRLTIGGDEALGRRRTHPVGVVFQHFALFDELSPTGNVAFAHAHRRRRADPPSTAPVELLDELGVPRHTRVSRLSGGQQQRLAIARTLSADPDVVLYDEPTSGLDPAASGRVADLIQRTHSTHPKTAIVVTHDYESLRGIADRIYVLDTDARTLVEVDRADWPRLRERLAPAGKPASTESGPGAARRAAAGLTTFLVDTQRAVTVTLTSPLGLLPLWRSMRWGLRYLAHYLRLVAGPSAFLYIAVAGAILGFVATHFTFAYLPYADYTEPLIKEEVLGTIGYGLYRILVPLIGTLLVAARCGAAVASDVGNKTYGRQLDALRSLGARPQRYLRTNVLWSFLIGTPLLVAAAFMLARWTSLVVFTVGYPDLGPRFWDQHLHAQLAVPGHWWFAGTGWVLAKTLVAAFGVGLITYHEGVRPKPSATAVSTSITRAILWATLWVLVVHFAFAFVEFDAPG